MVVKPSSRALRIHEVALKLREKIQRDAAAAAEEKRKLHEEMYTNLFDFFQSSKMSNELDQEGKASRLLLQETHKELLFYAEGESPDRVLYYLYANGEVKMFKEGDDGHDEDGGVKVSLDKLARILIEDGVSFDQILETVRTEIDRIVDQVIDQIEEKKTLPKQTHPVVG